MIYAEIVETVMCWSVIVAGLLTLTSVVLFASEVRKERLNERLDSKSWREVGKFELKSREKKP